MCKKINLELVGKIEMLQVYGFVPNNPRWFGDICHFELDRKQKKSLIVLHFPNM